LLSGADAIAMTPLVDHVLIVVQAGKTSIHDVEKAVSLIPREKILGIVLNRVDKPPEAVYGRYGA
jgi:protein-tyrosine kinase